MTTGIERAKQVIIAKHEDASFWRRHYEVDYQQSGSAFAQRTGKYYEGLMRGYEVALAELDAVKA